MLRWIAALCGALASVFGVGLIVLWSWHRAAPTTGQMPRRLHWYASVTRPIAAGTVLRADELRQRLARLPDDRSFVQTIAAAQGRFALTDISPGWPLAKDAIATVPAVDVFPGGAVIPVEVSTDHVPALVPGMWLAFASDKEMLPSAADLGKKHPEPSFKLLAIGPSPRKPEITSLLVAVPKCRLPLSGRLGSGVWRPVILTR